MGISSIKLRLSGRSTLATASIFDLAARAPVDIITPVVSLVGGIVDWKLVGLFTTWLLAAGVFYWFAPLAFSLIDELKKDKRQPGFKTIFAIGVVSTGILNSSTVSISLSRLAPSIIFGVILSCYLSWKRERELFDLNGVAAGIINQWFGSIDAKSEMKNDLEQGGVPRYFTLILMPTAMTAVFVLLIFAGGLLSRVFVMAYPLPDILVLSWALGAVVFDRISIGPSRLQVVNTEFDFERFTVDSLDNITRGTGGGIMSIFIMTGMLVSAGYFSVVFSNLSGTYELLTNGTELLFTVIGDTGGIKRNINVVELGINLWNIIVTTLSLICFSVFALWGWIREWERLPHFLDYWNDQNTTDEDPPSRPPGFMILPSAGAALYTIYLRFSLPNPLSASLIDYSIAVFLPFLSIILLWIWLQAYRSKGSINQSVKWEHFFIAGGLLTWSSPLLLHDRISSIDEIIIVYMIVLFGFTFMIVSNRAHSGNGLVHYIDSVFLTGWGVIFSVTLSVYPPKFRTLLRHFSVFLIFVGILYGIVKVYDNSY